MGFRVRASYPALAGLCVFLGAAAAAHAASVDGPAPGAPSVSFGIVSPRDFDGDVRALSIDAAVVGVPASDPARVRGDVGSRHYIESAGDSWGVFDKYRGTLLAQIGADRLWSQADAASPCAAGNADLAALHDPIANRWILTSSTLAPDGAPYACLAVSKTADPVHGGFALYAVPLRAVSGTARPEQAAFGLSPDCLLMGATHGASGALFAAFERNALYAGGVLTANSGSIGALAAQDAVLSPATLPPNDASARPGESYFVEQAQGDAALHARAFRGAATPCGAGATLGAALRIDDAASAFARGPIYGMASGAQTSDSGTLLQAVCATCSGVPTLQWLSTAIAPGAGVTRALDAVPLTRAADFSGLTIAVPAADAAQPADAATPLALDPADGCTLWFSAIDAGASSPGAAATRIGALRDAQCVLPFAPAAASKLAFAQQPTNTKAATAITPAVTVQVQDSGGVVDPTSTASVTMALGTNPGGATLSGTTTVSAVAGIATFNNLKLDKAGTGYTLAASSSGLSGATSNTFNITAGAPASITFSVQPVNAVAGTTIPVTAHVQDANGNPVAGDNVTLAIGSNPGGSTLTVTTNPVATNASGDAVFSGVSLNKVGSYTLRVTESSASFLTTASNSFAISAGPPASITFSTQPVNAVAGGTMLVGARVLDANGNGIAGDVVTLSIANNPGGSTLTVNANPATTGAAGDAFFVNTSLNKVGTGYTLRATDSSTPALTVVSNAFNITAGPAASITFSTQPVSSAAGAAIPVVVHVQDANANPVSGDNVTLAIANNPGASTLTVTANPVATNASGNASFSGVSLNKTATGYTLKATDSSSPALNVTSSAFNISAGPPAQVTFSTQPVSSTAGATIPVVAHVQDANANPVSGDNVTLAIANNPGGATLSVTTNPVATNASGNATFAGVSLNKIGTGYTLKLTDASTPAIAATSNAFNISAGPPAAISFGTQPGNAAAGATIPVVVHVQDAGGNPLAGDSITLAIANNAGGATLTVTTNPVSTNASGNATFAGVSLNKTGTGYTLKATDASTPALSVTSSAFNITPGAAAAIAFTTQPVNAAAGAAIPVVAHVQDANGNAVPGENVTLALANNPGGASLSVTANPVATNASGDASFAGVALNKVGTGYTLKVTDAALSATSSAFNITTGAAAAVSFSTQPVNAASGATIPVVVHVQDAGGNPVSGDNVTLSIANNPGGASLSVTANPVATNASGDATFAGVSLDKAGAGYTLKAADASTPALSATSNAFTISAGAAAALAFATQPSTTASGVAITPAVTVQVQDAAGNPVGSSTAVVTIALANNPGGATLTGTTTSNAVGGVATFATLKLDKLASGYTLGATSAGLAPATSAAFAITAGPPASVAFSTQPANATVGATIPVVAHVQDAAGNPVQGDSVTLALANNPGGATLSVAANPVTTNAAGDAAFAGVSLDKAGTGYTLSVTEAQGALGATSSAFNIAAGVPAVITFSTPPASAVAGATIPVVAHVRDAGGNPIAGDNVTLTIATNPGGATLTVAANPVATNGNGDAVFAGVSLNKAATGYKLRVTDSSSPALRVTSAAFDISAGPASQLVFTTQPANVSRGNRPAVVVVAEQDANGNVVTSDTGTIAFGAPACAATANLGSVAMTAGVATFGSTQRFYTLATGLHMTATKSALSASSAAFNVVANSEYIFADGLEGCRL